MPFLRRDKRETWRQTVSKILQQRITTFWKIYLKIQCNKYFYNWKIRIRIGTASSFLVFKKIKEERLG